MTLITIVLCLAMRAEGTPLPSAPEGPPRAAVLLQRVGYRTTLRANAAGKLAVFGMARVLDALPDLVRASFGDVMRGTPVKEAFASAYFLAARPRPDR